MHADTFAPGARVLIRDEEWMIRRVQHARAGSALHVVGLSELVRNQEALFLTELDDVEVLRAEDTTLVRDDSAGHRQARLYLEALLRRSPPTDHRLVIGHQGAIRHTPYQWDPAAQALKQMRPRILMADGVGLDGGLTWGLDLEGDHDSGSLEFSVEGEITATGDAEGTGPVVLKEAIELDVHSLRQFLKLGDSASKCHRCGQRRNVGHYERIHAPGGELRKRIYLSLGSPDHSAERAFWGEVEFREFNEPKVGLRGELHPASVQSRQDRAEPRRIRDQIGGSPARLPRLLPPRPPGVRRPLGDAHRRHHRRALPEPLPGAAVIPPPAKSYRLAGPRWVLRCSVVAAGGSPLQVTLLGASAPRSGRQDDTIWPEVV